MYGFFFILVTGAVGNTFNLIAFSTKDFRAKASIFYLICSTAWSQVLIVFGIIFRFTTEYFGNNLTNIDRYACKVRNYLFISLPLMSAMCVFLASFDRCVSTSSRARWRQLSSISFARRICPAAVVFIVVSSSFFFFVYDIYNGRCIAIPGLGSIMINVYLCVFSLFVPIGGMSVCGIMTWVHLKQSRHRIEAMSTFAGQTPNNRRMNRQLIILTFVQALLCIGVYLVRNIVFVYGIATTSVQKSVQQQQIEYFVQQVTVMLLYINHAAAFYLNYTFSKAFRKIFHASMRHLIQKCIRFCKCG